MVLKVEKLSKVYHRSGKALQVLSGLSLSVQAGEFVAVQGKSGCGKTTLLLAAGGLLGPDAGDVVVDGCSLYRMSANARAASRAMSIGFVFQQFHLVPYLSVLENVIAPAFGHAKAVRHRATELIEQFGLAHRIEHTPAELSTGERQRTALARAMLNRPKLILADEPTGNLDKGNAERVLEYLAQFTADGGAVLLVTHGPEAAERADRIYELTDGRLIRSH